jgi:ketosteroid isomerase-like protein
MGTPGTNVTEPVASFLAAVNAHDRQAFRDKFTQDSVVNDWGQVITGRDNIEKWSDTAFIGSQPHFTVERTSITDGTVTVIGDWRSTHANGPSRFDFDIDGDRITMMTISEG